MRVLILHHAVATDSSPDDADVLAQAGWVAAALGELGADVDTVACDLDFRDLLDRCRTRPPDVVFNLVECLGGSDRLAFLAPALLEALAIPCAGNPARVLQDLAAKTTVKGRLRAAGLPTPDWVVGTETNEEQDVRGRWIIKPVWEHASRGMGADAVVEVTGTTELLELLRSHQAAAGTECFAERFVEGREFNLSMLGDGANGPVVLPPAEIDFSAFPEHMPRIVDYRAKWVGDSFEYANTPRRFGFDDDDAGLLAEMIRICHRAWRLLELAGWARIDFRVDVEGCPWVLEVNANPCLAPDAGFVAAAQEAGLSAAAVVRSVLNDARNGRPPQANA